MNKLIDLLKNEAEYTEEKPPMCEYCMHIISREWDYYCGGLSKFDISVKPSARCKYYEPKLPVKSEQI